SQDGRIWGTYIHGIFDNDVLRQNFLNQIRKNKNLTISGKNTVFDPDREYDNLAILLKNNIDMDCLKKIIDKGV
ncbi:MAG: cobyric acid synthase CobQ, partial [Candidatus Omnitrophota bacterium]